MAAVEKIEDKRKHDDFFGHRNRTRERCSKKLRYYLCFGENVLSVHLFRHGIRRATFPRGEGKGAAAPVQQNDKLKFETVQTMRKDEDK